MGRTRFGLESEPGRGHRKHVQLGPALNVRAWWTWHKYQAGLLTRKNQTEPDQPGPIDTPNQPSETNTLDIVKYPT